MSLIDQVYERSAGSNRDIKVTQILRCAEDDTSFGKPRWVYIAEVPHCGQIGSESFWN
jgi:hypothetical protein